MEITFPSVKEVMTTDPIKIDLILKSKLLIIRKAVIDVIRNIENTSLASSKLVKQKSYHYQTTFELVFNPKVFKWFDKTDATNIRNILYTEVINQNWEDIDISYCGRDIHGFEKVVIVLTPVKDEAVKYDLSKE
ncbi:hypothetical protein [Pseudomonas aeruginosa]|uniref:hypothetical protein n=1 Tax=Pseudomonas aeruginosa TaxID=287 RepID=UPI001CA59FD7|nr:hypothetical protein [Pseudomonas aeruginosa]MBW6070117.1 hypothetical protein [Pseudomonas aeruginosa]